MHLETTRFGSLDIPEEDFIHFPWGLPGFEETKRYVLMQHRNGPFQWLQAVDHPAVAFVVCPPEALGVVYAVPDEKTVPIGLENKEDLLILNLISFDRSSGATRIHVRSPLLINAEARKAYQWTIDAKEVQEYVTTTPDFPSTMTLL